MIHYLIHHRSAKTTLAAFIWSLDREVNNIDFKISLDLEACSGSMDGSMYKKDNFSIEKHFIWMEIIIRIKFNKIASRCMAF